MEKDESLRVGELNSGMKIQLLLDMQEHPDQFSEQALKTMLDDPEVRELMEATAQLKQAMISEELKVKSEEFAAVDIEWQRFAQTHLTEQKTERSWLKILCIAKRQSRAAASFIGVLLITGIAFAAIHIVRQYQKQETPQTEIREKATSPVTTLPADTLAKDTVTVQPIIYDNIPLEKILPEIVAHYDVKVVFANDEARGLRFRFVWNPQQGIEQVVNDLNQFERLTVTLKGHQITVNSQPL